MKCIKKKKNVNMFVKKRECGVVEVAASRPQSGYKKIVL